MRRMMVWGLVACSILAAAVQDKPPAKPVRLVNDADLYCSFLALESRPALRIKSAERGEEHALLTQGELFLFDRAPGDGLAEGGRLTILELGETIRTAAPGGRALTVAYQRGRARIVVLDPKSARARIERACGPVEAGQALVPFVEREPVMGIDQGFAGTERKADGPRGRILFLGPGVRQSGSGQWALVDLGTEHGVGLERQLTVFREEEKNAVWQGLANAIVILPGPRVSTVKILSARDAVRPGDAVQIR